MDLDLSKAIGSPKQNRIHEVIIDPPKFLNIFGGSQRRAASRTWHEVNSSEKQDASDLSQNIYFPLLSLVIGKINFIYLATFLGPLCCHIPSLKARFVNLT